MFLSLVTLGSGILWARYGKSILDRLKEEGLIKSRKDTNIVRPLIKFIPLILFCFIPYLNIVGLISGVALTVNKDIDEYLYQTVKKILLKTNIINENKDFEIPVNNVKEIEKEEIKEEPIRTYQDAQALWRSQHEEYVSSCPTLPTMDEINNQDSIEKGYQKTIGGR